MPRWYGARLCTGKPEVRAEEIATLVKVNRLQLVLPQIRFQKKAAPKSQYYMFLAFESDTPGHLPLPVQRLRQHPIFASLIHGSDGRVTPFSFESISTMVSGEVSVQDLARRLRMEQAEPAAEADPFALGELSEAAVDDVLERTQRFDRLLYWLSATGSGSRTSLFGACKAMDLTSAPTEIGPIMRRLRLLGHIELSADGTQWSAAPAVLASIGSDNGAAGYVLCGERDARLIERLYEAGTMTISPQAGDAPARVCLHTGNRDELEDWLGRSGLPRPPRLASPAAQLAELLPPIQHWQQLLAPAHGVQPALYDLCRYGSSGFERQALAGTSGLYELWPANAPRGVVRPQMTLFFDAPRGRWLRGDWYGLRYLARQADGLPCTAQYNVLTGSLALLDEARPPEIYERALVLCSGTLPSRSSDWLVYERVPPEIFNTLAVRLNLTQEA